MNADRPRVLLLNPPHRRAVVRDCYCSEIMKAGYYWHQLDLLVQAALLAEYAEVKLIDAVAANISPETVLARAREFRPDWVLCLVAEIVEADDFAFAGKLRAALPDSRLFASGDVFLETPEQTLAGWPAFEGVLTEFISPAFAEMVRGDEPSYDLALRDGDGVRLLPRSPAKTFSYPAVPDLFDPRHYRLPFHGGEKFASVLASYGCPFTCRFCHVPALGYKARDSQETLSEIADAYRQGYRNFYMRDATFAVKREPALTLCAGIAEQAPGIRWNVFTRADLLDDELLDALAASGCAVVQIGAESLDDDVRRKVDKAFDLDHLRRILAGCRDRGMLTSLHFVVGLPGDDWILSDRAASDLRALDPDYLSLNVLRLRPGTALRREGYAIGEADLTRWRAVARRLNLRFYLRPGRIAAELVRLKDPRSVMRAAGLFASMFVGRRR